MGNREEDFLPSKKLVIQVIMGAAAGLLVSILIAAIISLAVAKGALPSDKALVIAMICTLAGVFTGSFFTVRKHKGKRWLLGLAVGLCVFLLLFALGLIFSLPREGVPQMMATSLLAGLLGGLPKSKRKHKSKR